MSSSFLLFRYLMSFSVQFSLKDNVSHSFGFQYMHLFTRLSLAQGNKWEALGEDIFYNTGLMICKINLLTKYCLVWHKVTNMEQPVRTHRSSSNGPQDKLVKCYVVKI